MFLEYIVIIGVVGFCLGLGWLFISGFFGGDASYFKGVDGMKRFIPLIIMISSILLMLVGFSLYWRRIAGLSAGIIILGLLAIQILVTLAIVLRKRGCSVKLC